MITREKVKEEITRILKDPGFYDQHESEGAEFLLTLIDPYIKQVARDTRHRCFRNPFWNKEDQIEIILP